MRGLYAASGFFIFIISSFASVLGGCASSPAAPAVQDADTAAGRPADTVPLSVPDNIASSVFSFSDKSIMTDLEIGSPASLKRAVSKIRKAAVEYTYPDKLLLSVAAGIMKLAWPDEPVTWDIPAVPDDNPYTGAIASAQLGVYDTNSGKSDFLTLALPSLVLMTPSRQNDYFEESAADLKAALGLNPNSVLAHYLLGVLYRRQGRNTDALAEFQTAYVLDDTCFRAAYMLGDTYRLAGRTEDAFALAVRLLEKYPRSTDVLKLCAETSFSLGDYDAAERYVAQVLQQEPENGYYVLFRVRILVEKGDYIRAASLLDGYGRTDNTSKDYLILRALIQQEWNKNPSSAASTMEDALVRYPDDKDVILYAAVLANMTGQPIAGKSAGELAGLILNEDPENKDALNVSIAESMRLRRWEKAYNDSAFLLSLSGPDIPDEALLQHIEVCLERGYFDEAARYAYALYKADPDDESVCRAYLQVLAAEGKNAAANALIEEKLPGASQSFKSFLYYQRGMLRNDSAGKLADFRASLTSNPRNPDALYQLYLYYYRQADYRKAQYYLKQAIALDPGDAALLELAGDLEKKL